MDAGQQVGGHVRSAADTARQVVAENAGEVKEKTGDQVRSQLDSRTAEAGRQVRSVADAMRRGGSEVDGDEQVQQLVRQTADAIDRLGRYLEDADADRILGDVERLARRRPWLVGAGTFALGLAASRFLKASSAERSRSGSPGLPADGRPEDAPLAREQAALPPVETAP